MLKLKSVCDSIRNIKLEDGAQREASGTGQENKTQNIQIASPKEEVKTSVQKGDTQATEELKELEREQGEEKARIIKKLLAHYNLSWLKSWQSTVNFQIWRTTHSPTLYCLSEFVGKHIGTPHRCDIKLHCVL